MVTLSLCMIAKNEEQFIGRSLESVKSLVDEMIIVDTGSTDTTIEIAKKHGAKVIEHPWNDSFSEARNFSLKQAAGDWILVLDSDETIAKKDLEKIRNLIDSGEADGYALIQRNYANFLDVYFVFNDGEYEEAEGCEGWHPSYIVRLFRNHQGYRFRYLVHELVEPSIEEKNGQIVRTKIPIHHFTYKKSPGIIDHKVRYYLSLLERQIKLTPDHFKPYYQAASQYVKLREYEKALELSEKAYSLNHHYPALTAELSFLYVHFKRYKEAESLLTEAVKLFPEHIDLMNNLGGLFLTLGKVDEALHILTRSIEMSKGNPGALNNLGVLYIKKGELTKAIHSFQKAIVIHPSRPDVHFNLGCVYQHLGKNQEAAEAYRKELKVNKNHAKAKKLLEELIRKGLVK